MKESKLPDNRMSKIRYLKSEFEDNTEDSADYERKVTGIPNSPTLNAVQLGAVRRKRISIISTLFPTSGTMILKLELIMRPAQGRENEIQLMILL